MDEKHASLKCKHNSQQLTTPELRQVKTAVNGYPIFLIKEWNNKESLFVSTNKGHNLDNLEGTLVFPGEGYRSKE